MVSGMDSPAPTGERALSVVALWRDCFLHASRAPKVRAGDVLTVNADISTCSDRHNKVRPCGFRHRGRGADKRNGGNSPRDRSITWRIPVE